MAQKYSTSLCRAVAMIWPLLSGIRIYKMPLESLFVSKYQLLLTRVTTRRWRFFYSQKIPQIPNYNKKRIYEVVIREYIIGPRGGRNSNELKKMTRIKKVKWHPKIMWKVKKLKKFGYTVKFELSPQISMCVT